MRLSLLFLLGIIFIGLNTPAYSLTPDEVIRLKKAGVSDSVIQKMLEQEKKGVSQNGPMQETDDTITYQAGEEVPEEIEQSRRREKEKQDKSMEVLKGVIIDTRQNPSN